MEPPQIDAVTSATTLATLSIGGNDAGFERVLAACLYRPEDPGQRRLPAAGVGRPGASPPPVSAGSTCASPDAYAAIATRMAPGGRLVVVGYPRLFADGGRALRGPTPAGGRAGVSPRA